MTNYLQEAFKKLDILEEETFTADEKGFEGLKNLIDSDDVVDDVVVIDGDAETEDELQDSYVGKVILDCCVCHSKIYEDKEEVVVDETGEWANVDKECPFCFSTDGYKVIGEVAPFEKETEEGVEVKVDGNEIGVEEKEEEKFESFDSRARKTRIKESVKRARKRVVKESKETGEDLSEYQKWVDYDMKKYRKISDDTMKKIKSAGLSVVKDQYGDYEVIADRPVKEACKKSRRNSKSLKESNYDYDVEYVAYSDTDANNENEYFDNLDDAIEYAKENGLDGVIEVNYVDGTEESVWENDFLDESRKKSRRNKKSVDESVEVKATDENDVEVVKNDDGSLDVRVGSTETVDEGETIVPLDDETKVEIEYNSVEDEEAGEDEMIDFDVDEFSEEDFDGLGESYLKRIYNNVESYKTVKASSGNNKLYLEGVITFKSGNKKKTNFVFEAFEATKSNKAKFIGENTQISKNKKAFTISGKFNEGKFIAESLNYNYRAKDAVTGKSKRIYGTVKK